MRSLNKKVRLASRNGGSHKGLSANVDVQGASGASSHRRLVKLLADFSASLFWSRADWTAADEDAEDAKQWQDDWDDDDVTGDFSQSLRAEIEKCKAAAAAK